VADERSEPWIVGCDRFDPYREIDPGPPFKPVDLDGDCGIRLHLEELAKSGARAGLPPPNEREARALRDLSLKVRYQGWPQGPLALAAIENRTPCLRSPLGWNTTNVEPLKGMQPYLRRAEIERPVGVEDVAWASRSFELHVESRGFLPDLCTKWAVELLDLEFEAYVGAIKTDEPEGRRLADRVEDLIAARWSADTAALYRDHAPGERLDPGLFHSLLLNGPPVFDGPPDRRDDPREPCAGLASHWGPARREPLLHMDASEELRADASERQKTWRVYGMACDILFLVDRFGFVLDSSGAHPGPPPRVGGAGPVAFSRRGYPLTVDDIRFRALFHLRAWAWSTDGLYCELDFAVPVRFRSRFARGLPGRDSDLEPRDETRSLRQLPFDTPGGIATGVRGRISESMFRRPPTQRTYRPTEVSTESMWAFDNVKKRVQRIEVDVGPWPKFFVVEVGAGQHLYPEAAGTALEKDKLFSRDQTILVVWLNRPLPGHDTVLPRLYAVPQLDGGRPYLMLPFAAGSRIEIDHKVALKREAPEGVDAGTWVVEFLFRLVAEDRTASVCSMVFNLSRGLRCHAVPTTVIDTLWGYRHSRFEFQNLDVMYGSCSAKIADQEAEFVFATDTGAIGSPSFDAAYTRVYGAEGRRYYRNNETGRLFAEPTEEDRREAEKGGFLARGDCLLEETSTHILLRTLVDFTPAAPFFLAYEAASGRSWASGIRLSDGERTFAGVGLFLSALGHLGGISKMRQAKATKSATKADRVARKLVEDLIGASELPASFGKGREDIFLDLIEGASDLTKRQRERIETAVDILRQHRSATVAQRETALLSALGDANGLKKLRKAFGVLARRARARELLFTIVFAEGPLAVLSKREKHVVGAFLSSGRVTEDMIQQASALKKVEIVDSGVLVKIGSEPGGERVARAIAARGNLVIVPPGGKTARRVADKIENALGVTELMSRRGVQTDVVAAEAVEGLVGGRVAAVEVYSPQSLNLPELAGKLQRPQAAHLIIEAVPGARVGESIGGVTRRMGSKAEPVGVRALVQTLRELIQGRGRARGYARSLKTVAVLAPPSKPGGHGTLHVVKDLTEEFGRPPWVFVLDYGVALSPVARHSGNAVDGLEAHGSEDD